jgi:hypothetical protein
LIDEDEALFLRRQQRSKKKRYGDQRRRRREQSKANKEATKHIFSLMKRVYSQTSLCWAGLRDAA